MRASVGVIIYMYIYVYIHTHIHTHTYSELDEEGVVTAEAPSSSCGGVEMLAGVLGQCPALAHLNLQYNGIESVGEGRLRAS